MESEQCLEVNIRLVHYLKSEWFRCEHVKFVAIMPFTIGDMVLVGILPRKSSKVCILTAPLLYLPNAHAASFMLVDMVVESKA